MDRFTSHSALEYSSNELATILTKCFEGYLVPFVLNGSEFAGRFWPEGLDAGASQIWFEAENPVGICLIARQGWNCRVAAMAIAPEFRGQGVGSLMMEKAVEGAMSRGDRRFILEVIEQNQHAINLYKKVGMQTYRRLVGYTGSPTAAPADLKEVDPSVCIRHLSAECSADLPWDFKPETLVAKGPPTIGLHLEEKAFAVLTDSPKGRVVLWSLFVKKEHRRQGFGERILRGIAHRYPGKPIITPIALPDDLAPEFAEKLNLAEHEITQLEMRMEL